MPSSTAGKHRTMKSACQRHDDLASIWRAWPYPVKISPYYLEIRREANAWFLSYQPFATRERDQFLVESDIPYLAAICLPAAARDRLRNACDLMALLIYRDDEFDHASGQEREEMIAAAQRCLRDEPDNAASKWLAPFRDVWQRITAHSTADQRDRLLTTIEDYLAGCAAMTRPVFTTIEDYLHLRRSSIGVRIDLALIEYALNLSLSPRQKALLRRVDETHLDTMIVVQDLLSYGRAEDRDGDAENIVAQFTRIHDCSVATARSRSHELLRTRIAEFEVACHLVQAQRDGHSAQVGAYLEGTRDFSSGVIAWTAHSVRYRRDHDIPTAREART